MAMCWCGVLAAGDAPNPSVSAHVLLTYFQTAPLSIVADAVLAAIAAAYLLGVRRLSVRGRKWPFSQSLSFLLGLFLVFVAIGSGLAAYDGLSLSAHVIQHLLLMMVGAPLLAIGRPITLIAQASDRRVQVAVLRMMNSDVAMVLTSPLSWALYYGSMWVFFVTPVYAFSGRHPLFHDGTHVLFVTVGFLFWQGIVGLDGSRHRVSHPMRVVGLLVGAPLEAFLGLTIMSMATPIAPGYSLANTHNGGSVFWITSMFVMTPAIIVTLRQWVKTEERQGRRLDVELARPGVTSLTDEQIAELRRIAAPGRPLSS